MIEREGFDESGHRYRIERTDPEGDAWRLALQLGCALDGEQVERINSEFYFKEAEVWDAKALALQALLLRVRRRDAGEPVVTTSRMDPALTYDAESIRREKRKVRKTADQFRRRAEQHSRRSKAHRIDFDRVQRKLADGHARI